MARGPKQDYGPEIHNSVRDPTMRKSKRANPPKRESAADKKADTPAELARDAKRGIPEGTPRDETMDVGPQMAQHSAPQVAQQVVPQSAPQSGGIHPHHVTAASGIAHAILQSGRGG